MNRYSAHGCAKKHTDGMSRRQRRAHNKLIRKTNPSYANIGRPTSEPLDPKVERPQPLLVVKRPLSLAQVAHQYVASVFIECGCDKAKARRTLCLSAGGLQRYLDRIESGKIGETETHIHTPRKVG